MLRRYRSRQTSWAAREWAITILLLTGGTKVDDLLKYAYQPDIIVSSIADLCETDKFMNELLPTMNREDDTPHDRRSWNAANS